MKPESSPLTDTTVLLVEDDAWILADLKASLTRHGATVTTASTLAAALAQCEQPFDTAILDIRLGDALVTEAAELLHKNNVPLIFHSGAEERSAILDRFPTAQVLSKPASETSLIKTVREVVRGA